LYQSILSLKHFERVTKRNKAGNNFSIHFFIFSQFETSITKLTIVVAVVVFVVVVVVVVILAVVVIIIIIVVNVKKKCKRLMRKQDDEFEKIYFFCFFCEKNLNFKSLWWIASIVCGFN